MSGAAFAPCRAVLANGMTFLHQHNPASRTVTVSLSFPGGSCLDSPGREGLATLMARGLVRGTERRTKAEIGEILDERGAHLAGSAGRHTAGLVVKARDVDFESLLDLALECARVPVFPDDEVRKLLGDRLTALREDDDDPATLVAKQVRELIYPPEHPYAWRHRGTPESIAAIAPADLRAFHKRHFRVTHGLLVVVGGVDREHALAAVRKAAESWEDTPDEGGFRGAIPAIPDAPSLTTVREIDTPMPDKLQSDVALGMVGIRRTDPRFYAAALMNSVLGQFAMGGRLGRSVREEQGMAYYTYSALDATVGPGPFVVRAGVAAANVERAIASIRAEIERIRSEPVSEQELDDARSATIRSLPRTLESNEGMAGLLHKIEMFGLGLDYLERFPAAFAAIGVDDVLEAARELLAPDAYGLAVAGPPAAAEVESAPAAGRA